MKKALLCITAVALLTLSLGLSKTSHAKPPASEQSGSREQYQVKIDNFSFGPPNLTVAAGTTVTWINQDDVPHNVVSSEGKTLKSPVLDTDQKFSYTFTAAGTYPYYCGLHPKMTGKVIVQCRMPVAKSALRSSLSTASYESRRAASSGTLLKNSLRKDTGRCSGGL